MTATATRNATPLVPTQTTWGGNPWGVVLQVAAVALLAWRAVVHGLTADDLFGAVSVIVVTQVLPGAVAWRAVRPRVGSWTEDLAMGFAVGAFGAALAQSLAAAVGLVSGTLFLGERYALLTWAGAAIIGIGVAMTTRAQSRES